MWTCFKSTFSMLVLLIRMKIGTGFGFERGHVLETKGVEIEFNGMDDILVALMMIGKTQWGKAREVRMP